MEKLYIDVPLKWKKNSSVIDMFALNVQKSQRIVNKTSLLKKKHSPEAYSEQKNTII